MEFLFPEAFKNLRRFAVIHSCDTFTGYGVAGREMC